MLHPIHLLITLNLAFHKEISYLFKSKFLTGIINSTFNVDKLLDIKFVLK